MIITKIDRIIYGAERKIDRTLEYSYKLIVIKFPLLFEDSSKNKALRFAKSYLSHTYKTAEKIQKLTNKIANHVMKQITDRKSPPKS